MCLVDTVGIGSEFPGNTESTKDFIPQIDAAILVVGADPRFLAKKRRLLKRLLRMSMRVGIPH